MLLEEKLHKALWNLNPEEKVIIHCRFWEHMSILEISHFLGYSWDETYQLLNETLKELREELADYQDYSLKNAS